MSRLAGLAKAVAPPVAAFCAFMSVTPATATLSEVRLGNVVVDCADLPVQIARNMRPCSDFYTQLVSRSHYDLEFRLDPLVELTNGMVFRCSELGAVASRLSECTTIDQSGDDTLSE